MVFDSTIIGILGNERFIPLASQCCCFTWRNIAEQSSEDRPLVTCLLNATTDNISRDSPRTHLRGYLLNTTKYYICATHHEHIRENMFLSHKNYNMARLIKRTSPRIYSKSKHTMFWRNSRKAHHRKCILNPNT